MPLKNYVIMFNSDSHPLNYIYARVCFYICKKHYASVKTLQLQLLILNRREEGMSYRILYAYPEVILFAFGATAGGQRRVCRSCLQQISINGNIKKAKLEINALQSHIFGINHIRRIGFASRKRFGVHLSAAFHRQTAFARRVSRLTHNHDSRPAPSYQR